MGPERRGSGFTLIELLAVIAVLLILISLLVPSLEGAREQGSRAVCANNQRELQVGFLLFAAENGGMLPSSSTYTSGAANCTGQPDRYYPYRWAGSYAVTDGVVWAYVRNVSSYGCPAMPIRTNFKRHYSLSDFIRSPDYCSWGIRYSAETLSQVRNPQRTHCLIEEYDWRTDKPGNESPGPAGAYALMRNIPALIWVDAPPFWHAWGANFSYLDGHVAYHRWEGMRMRTVDLAAWKHTTEWWGGTPEDIRDFEWMVAGITNGYML